VYSTYPHPTGIVFFLGLLIRRRATEFRRIRMRSIACAMTLTGARHFARIYAQETGPTFNISFYIFSHYQMYRAQVEEGHNECLEVLVAAGADLNARYFILLFLTASHYNMHCLPTYS